MVAADKWIETTLGECFRLKHGWAFRGEFFADSGTYVLLTPGNFRPDGGLEPREGREKFYIGEFPHEYLLQRGELLIVLTDLIQNAPILGSPVIISESEKYLHNQRLGRVVDIDDTKLRKSFLYHLLNAPFVREQIKATATGSTVRHTAPERVYAVRAKLPGIATQERVANILSAYDDLIENNTRRVKVLEQIAEMIYRHWFVNFCFPGHEKVTTKKSDIGPIPCGWRVADLDEVVDEIIDYRGKTPKKLGADWAENGVLALSALNVKQGRLVNLKKAKFVSEELYCRWMKSELDAGDILMTSEAPLGQLYMFTERKRYCLSQRLFSIRANPERILPSILYSFLSSHDGREQINARASGTTVLGIRQAELRKVPILVPELGVQKQANEILFPLYRQIEILQKKKANLRATRDLLLPKLVCGEVSVEQLESKAIEQNV